MSRATKIHWDEGATARVNARMQLPALIGAYFEEVRSVLAKSPKPAGLHAVRLASKRLRYTLELFRTCYGKGFEDRIHALRAIQQSLGEINDRVASRKLLSEILPPSPQRHEVRVYLKHYAATKAQEFRQLWEGEFDAPGRERWWVDYFAVKRGVR